MADRVVDLGGVLGRLFGRDERQPRTDGGLYVRVRCDACGEIVQSRIDPSADLSLADNGQGYFVRKVLVGQQCFRPIEVQIRFVDQRGSEISREVQGGTSVG